jgi:hypothetical protein
MANLIFSLDDFTALTGWESEKEAYCVTFGYDRNGNAEAIPVTGVNILADLTGKQTDLKRWFFLGLTPMIKVRKKHKHVFPGGLPIYCGPKSDFISVYLAIMESDEKSRDAGLALREFMKGVDTNPLMKAALALTTMTQPEIAAVNLAVSLAIKGIEEALIRNGDDIDYTNVFTFKESNDYLVGKHTNWGNQRYNLSFSVEVR